MIGYCVLQWYYVVSFVCVFIGYMVNMQLEYIYLVAERENNHFPWHLANDKQYSPHEYSQFKLVRPLIEVQNNVLNNKPGSTQTDPSLYLCTCTCPMAFPNWPLTAHV